MDEKFQAWWAEIGSTLCSETDLDDVEEHTYYMCKLAWNEALKSVLGAEDAA